VCGWLGQLGIKVIYAPLLKIDWVPAYLFCTVGEKIWIQANVGKFDVSNTLAPPLGFRSFM
jgi:hypothetical protein